MTGIAWPAISPQGIAHRPMQTYILSISPKILWIRHGQSDDRASARVARASGRGLAWLKI